MTGTACKPLIGKRVLVTRARKQSASLCEGIERLGGIAYAYPTIRIEQPASYEPLDNALRHIHTFQWIVFTSVNAVEHFFHRFDALDQTSTRQSIHASVAAVGSRTAAALEKRGLKVTLFPGEYEAEALLFELEKQVVKGQTILLPRANIARTVLPDGLRALGCEVVDVEAYRTEIETEHASAMAQLLVNREIDIITFTSSSTVRNFVKALDQTDQLWRPSISRVKIACIGPITADTARAWHLEPDTVAGDYTIEGLLTAIQQLV